MQVIMLMRLMSKGEYLIVPKGTKFTGSGKLGLSIYLVRLAQLWNHVAVYHYHLTYRRYFC